jgi:hypothetical protein
VQPTLADDPGALTGGHGLDALLDRWRSFGDGWLLLEMLLVLAVALLLGAAIAYHPSTRGRMSTLEHVEEPKTMLTYALVAAVVALMVEVQPAMAFVVFGIGGLLRFRTDAGSSKETGRVILVTVIGLCCGLKIFVVAVMATAIGWLVVWTLERQRTGLVRVTGVAEAAFQDAARAYRAAIGALGCRIIGEQHRFMRRELLFVVHAPPAVAREALQAGLAGVPDDIRGVVELEQL